MRSEGRRETTFKIFPLIITTTMRLPLGRSTSNHLRFHAGLTHASYMTWPMKIHHQSSKAERGWHHFIHWTRINLSSRQVAPVVDVKSSAHADRQTLGSAYSGRDNIIPPIGVCVWSYTQLQDALYLATCHMEYEVVQYLFNG